MTAGHAFLAAARANGSVSVLDAASGAQLSSLQLGSGATGKQGAVDVAGLCFLAYHAAVGRPSARCVGLPG